MADERDDEREDRIAVYALTRILAHIEEARIEAEDKWMWFKNEDVDYALIRGYAAAAVIVHRRLRLARQYDASVWQETKDAE